MPVLPAHRDAADALLAVARTVTDWAVDAMFAEDPSLEVRYGAQARKLWLCDTDMRVAQLAQAVAIDCPEIVVHAARWSRKGFEARGVPETDLIHSLAALRGAIEGVLPAAAGSRAAAALASAEEDLRQHMQARKPSRSGASNPGDEDEDAAMADVDEARADDSRRYLLALLEREPEAATAGVLELRREGVRLDDIYTEVIGPALREVGRMWHRSEVTVADEHFSTSASRRVIARLRADARPRPWNGKRILAANPAGDLHDFGLQMAADLFELDGWRVEFLGASTPNDAIISTLEGPDRAAFDLLVLCSQTFLSLRALAELIDEVRRNPVTAEVPIMVGGAPFREVSNLWKCVGADACADLGDDALQKARQLVGMTGGR
ncbi:MAG: B12-binding domain-containing protein [Phycisphaeraceae bacterium]|nr:B12-binding domain-containing protein [Phycisphaeraceae bacterium]